MFVIRNISNYSIRMAKSSMVTDLQAAQDLAKEYLKFSDDSPSPFHAVEECRKELNHAGFTELFERNEWIIKPKGKYFFARNNSSIVAFCVGGAYKPGNGFAILAGHTDSPCFKVKPDNSVNRLGYTCLGVSTYGGGLWYTWFDRDLTLAGRVVYKKGDGELHEKLFHTKRPILRIPSLCIHLKDASERDKFSPNKESHTLPVLATENIQKQLGGEESPLLSLLSSETGVAPDAILDFDISVADTQPASLGGLHSEFIFASRLDNQVACFTGIKALIGSIPSLPDDSVVRVLALYDNEECGSESFQGAKSNLLQSTIRRLSCTPDNPSPANYELALANSFLLSTDQAHAIHPSYSEKHEANHRPEFHKGIVLKINANQRYSTSGASGSIFKLICSRAGVPFQPFVVRNDTPCGSTVGPLISTALGVRGVDVGGPSLSMHSVREMCCVSSIQHMTQAFKVFFSDYSDISKKSTVL